MKLIKLTFRLADGGTTSRLATSATDVNELEARFLATIPGAVFCMRSVVEDDLAPGRLRAAVVNALDRIHNLEVAALEAAAKHGIRPPP